MFAGALVPSALSNSLALTLVTLMIILLVIIAMLGKLLVEIAGIKLKTEMEEKTKINLLQLGYCLLFFYC